ncbi:MAG: hypothetical protein LAT76_02770, partial [Schleiferiaceae bacterium]|nr:hypothetical protein [Schleiferiaceae bacterium]
ALEGIETISLEEEQLIRINEMLRKEATAIYLQIDDLQCKSELSQVYKLFYSKSERVVKQKIAAEHINLQSAIETLEQELEKISTLAKAKAYISNVKIVKAQTQESILGQLLKAVFTP